MSFLVLAGAAVGKGLFATAVSRGARGQFFFMTLPSFHNFERAYFEVGFVQAAVTG